MKSNVGTADATIDQIFINGKPHNAPEFGDAITVPSSVSLKAGESTTITITIDNSKIPQDQPKFSSGRMVEVKLHTASGKEYPKMVTLP